MAQQKTLEPSMDPFLKVLRPLVETYCAWFGTSDPHIRSLGLTCSQFDVIVTLGETRGMTCKDLSEKTLVTKGTLTGVLDRLTKKGLIVRVPSREDRRSIFVRLTPQGDAVFQKVFPAHIQYMKPYFQQALTSAEATTLRELLLRLKRSFERG